MRGQLVEFVDVSAAANDVVRLERRQLLDDFVDAPPPALLADSLEPAVADVILVRALPRPTGRQRHRTRTPIAAKRRNVDRRGTIVASPPKRDSRVQARGRRACRQGSAYVETWISARARLVSMATRSLFLDDHGALFGLCDRVGCGLGLLPAGVVFGLAFAVVDVPHVVVLIDPDR
jgi:hypothetical protein